MSALHRRDEQPTGLPQLTRGKHTNARSGTCLMEYVSILAGSRFTDRPRCTHPLLAWVARRVNDDITDDATRQQLVLRAPALIDTRVRDPRVRPTLLIALAEAGLAQHPDDEWLRHTMQRATRRLARLADPEHRPRFAQLCPSVDLASLYVHVFHSMCHRPDAERDRLLVAMLDIAITKCRGLLTLPTVPTAATPVLR
ncbi:hypothetical protein [Pseudonocardia asaccharolytica]|uniref:Uncharacterized protein n=1 Tax=Pseudonocardia asaccharolytica DSM 44247 = NBRC 16224 TaxID=1123024 RepID=A0A511D478_9PSEU|nr:hypothetical protein [Pseudonocardia asaccharolytica]GEL19599.1 hypothetical protein PA7_34360 [Pseudonocardia asaccharolytica DSM 44247 = NBRC 16224]